MPPSLDLDDWQSGDDARTVRRVLQTFGQRTIRNDSVPPQGRNQVAAQPHFVPTAQPTPCAAREPTANSDRPIGDKTSVSGTSSWLSWSLMAVGLTTLVCGAILLAWYVYDGRESLARIGLPLALGGQIALLSGLIMQLDALGQSNRSTVAMLHELDEQVQELRRTATTIGGTHSSGAKSIHMAKDASPNTRTPEWL